jgi:hypothetical protein
MEAVEIIAGIDAAVRLLRRHSEDHYLASGPDHIWQIVAHARYHIQQEVKSLLDEMSA